jgi:hypothetical protein
MSLRRLISRILGPPAVLFLVLVACYAAYQIVTGSFESRRMKSEASTAIDRFHDRFNRDDLSSACENEFAWREPPLDCVSQLKDVKLRFGSFQSVQKAKFEVISEPQWVRIETVSIFDKGELTERFLSRPGRGIVNYQAMMTREGNP